MDLLTTYQNYVKPFKGSSRFHTWAIISVMAAVLERRVWFPRGGISKLFPNQFIILCGAPGLGKTISSSLATNFLHRYNRSRGGDDRKVVFGPDKMTPAALLLHMQAHAKTLRDGAGNSFEQSAIYLHSTEFATMIKDIGGGAMSDDLLKLYDCSDRFEKQLVGHRDIIINGPCLNLLADTTPAFLSGFLPREDSGTGLTARIIFATQLGEVDIDPEVPEGDKVLEDSILRHLARMHALMGPFQVELKAKAFWNEWHYKHRSAMQALGDGTFMRHFYSRKPDHMRKIAMALAAGRDSSKIIRLEDYERSLALIEEAEPFMDKSFGVKDFRKVVDPSSAIVAAIPFAPNEIEQSQLINYLYYAGGLAGESGHFDGLIAHLVSGRIIKRRVDGGGATFYSRRAV